MAVVRTVPGNGKPMASANRASANAAGTWLRPLVAPPVKEQLFPAIGDEGVCNFDIQRAESVSVTSMLSSGGDWQWRLTAPSGIVLANSRGFRDEAGCRAAIAALRRYAASATISIRS